MFRIFDLLASREGVCLRRDWLNPLPLHGSGLQSMFVVRASIPYRRQYSRLAATQRHLPVMWVLPTGALQSSHPICQKAAHSRQSTSRDKAATPFPHDRPSINDAPAPDSDLEKSLGHDCAAYRTPRIARFIASVPHHLGVRLLLVKLLCDYRPLRPITRQELGVFITALIDRL